MYPVLGSCKGQKDYIDIDGPVQVKFFIVQPTPKLFEILPSLPYLMCLRQIVRNVCNVLEKHDVGTTTRIVQEYNAALPGCL